MVVAGIDLSTHAVDVVLLDLDSDRATWHRFELHGQDSFDRARAVRAAMPGASFWDDCLAIGIEQPRGRYGTQHIARVQGAVLACLPSSLLVQPWNPAAWRKAVGLRGDASKDAVAVLSRVMRWKADPHFQEAPPNDPADYAAYVPPWPQDACDAYCVALATRQALQQEEAA
jgi:hypothetical protein